MNAGLAIPCTIYAIVVGIVVMACGTRGVERPRVVVGALVVLELGLILHALSGVFESGVAEPGVHIAYAIASVLLLPIAWVVLGNDDGVWGSTGLAVALIAVAVVVMRMQATGAPIHA